ncbi:MAG: D-Ala-D-Ala carboxypeptidase family metallohydrolase [Sulfuricaulis sp.]|nr:D-Ala-D-Ala carboxypeptidase family metallohydrolase [Sulfuricaulis sp.]
MADLTQISWDAFPADAGPDDRVSADFKFYELTRSETATRLRIDNSFPSTRELRAAVFLCRNVLQPVRVSLGRFSPNSVFRCQELERALKKKRADWVSKSQHTLGQACDIEIPGMATLELAEWVTKNLEFDQVICECYDPAKGPNSGWVHVSIVPPGLGENRKASLSYVVDPATGKYVYVKGLKETSNA